MERLAVRDMYDDEDEETQGRISCRDGVVKRGKASRKNMRGRKSVQEKE